MPFRPPRIFPIGVAALTAGLALSAAPAAHAVTLPYVPKGIECRLVTSLLSTAIEGRALADPLGYVYDTGAIEDGYATLDEGSTQPLTLGLFADDAWDRFGGLLVGPTRASATLYRDTAQDAAGCGSEVAGRQVVFKTVRMGALDVQRRLFVSAGQGSGVRLLDSVTNVTDQPLTTNVYVGDIRSDPGGTLGSDDKTRITATSSADTTLSTADRWATTGDGRNLGPDPALAHVWGGEGAQASIDLVRSGAQAGAATAINRETALDLDQLGWGWEDVVVAPGETRSFLSWEIMRATADGKAASQTAAASAAAAEQSAAPLSLVYEGLTQAQIGGIRNWAKPAVAATIDPVVGATAAADTTLSARDLDFGSTQVAACTSGTLTWDFGDGASAVGRTVTHRFAPGAARVTVQVEGACGGRAQRALSFDVGAPSVISGTPETELPGPPTGGDRGQAPEAPAATPAPAASPAPGFNVPAPPTGLTIDVAPKLSAGELAKRGVRPTLLASAPGTVRLVLSGGGLKIVKTKQVAAGTVTPAAMKLGPKDGKRVRGLKTLQLRAKLSLADGSEVVTTRVITVGK